MLRQINNEDLFQLYDNDLVLRLHNAKNLSDTRNILTRFRQYLGNYPPSPELAKSYLAQYIRGQAALPLNGQRRRAMDAGTLEEQQST